MRVRTGTQTLVIPVMLKPDMSDISDPEQKLACLVSHLQNVEDNWI